MKNEVEKPPSFRAGSSHARLIRDAEKAEPGFVRRVLDEKLEAREEPTKAALRQAANALVHEFGTIIVGDVSPKKLAKTRMAKSVYDAGWAGFKGLLLYKSMRNGGRVLEVSEAMSSQTCSTCGCLPASRPTGIAGLGIRRWTCSDCGTEHDRDVNAAMNIARAGLSTLAEGAVP